jgi:hypothetical protein
MHAGIFTFGATSVSRIAIRAVCDKMVTYSGIHPRISAIQASDTDWHLLIPLPQVTFFQLK